MIQKWITWVIPSDDLQTTDKKVQQTELLLQEELSRVLGDIEEGIPITFKVTNQPRRRD